MRGQIFMAAVSVALLTASAALAQGQAMTMPMAATCPTMDATLPTGLAGWAAKTPLASAAATGGLGTAALTPGQAHTAQLHPAAGVTFPAPPGKAGGHGGLFALTVATAGTYRIALGAGAWIDLLSAGKPIAPISHAHGPDCSTVRKMVDFPLSPGAYVVQVSGNDDAVLAIMAAKLP